MFAHTQTRTEWKPLTQPRQSASGETGYKNEKQDCWTDVHVKEPRSLTGMLESRLHAPEEPQPPFPGL